MPGIQPPAGAGGAGFVVDPGVGMLTAEGRSGTAAGRELPVLAGFGVQVGFCANACGSVGRADVFFGSSCGLGRKQNEYRSPFNS